MHVSSVFRRSAASAAMVVAAFGFAANANAAPPKLGDCVPAETAKTELFNAGYKNYFVYDVELLSSDSPKPIWVRESIYAKDGLKEGYYVGRGGKSGELMCFHAKADNIILGSADDQASIRTVDAKFLSSVPANSGINEAINSVRDSKGLYPAIQLKFTQADGGQGYMTLVLNPVRKMADQLFSDMSGKVVGIRTELVAGAVPYTGYTPVALNVLEQMRKAEGFQYSQPK